MGVQAPAERSTEYRLPFCQNNVFATISVDREEMAGEEFAICEVAALLQRIARARDSTATATRR
jgi:hypothetical protein